MARGGVDGLEAKTRNDARGARLFDPSTERADLFADHFQRARDLARCRLENPHTQERQERTLPLRGHGRVRLARGPRRSRARRITTPETVHLAPGAHACA